MSDAASPPPLHHLPDQDSAFDIVLRLVKLAWPGSLASILTFVQNTVLLVFLGMFGGDAAVSAVGVGIAVLMVTALAFGWGCNSVLDTLVAQEYGRNPLSPKMGHDAKLALLCATIIAVGNSLMHVTVTPTILTMLFPLRPVLVHDVSCFLSSTGPFVMGSLFAHCLSKFCCNQRRPDIPSIAASASSALSVPIYFLALRGGGSWLLVQAGSAMGVVLFLQVVISFILIESGEEIRIAFDGLRMNFRWSSSVRPFLKYALASTPLVAGEAIAFNVVIIMS